LVTLFNYEDEITGALDSVARSEFEPLELVIVDDCSRDDSRARAQSWIESHPEVAARLIVHPANRGLPSARNTALEHARGELVFILDADNRVLPHALSRLAEALDSDPHAVLAYGLAARVDEDGRAVGLLNLGGWDPSRLRHLNYIDAMAMIRADVLREVGGYTTELTLYGWEDYDLWCRMAEAGMGGAYLPEILAIYRSSESSMARSVCDISTTDAYRALIERVPGLMAGVRPPR
jgi:glycosyltransferase involved in cell wall biosynthesis